MKTQKSKNRKRRETPKLFSELFDEICIPKGKGWELVGHFAVDSGLCWIGDPCYCVTPDAQKHPARTWDEFCGKLNKNEEDGATQWKNKVGAALGVSVHTGYGDGFYPVYARYVNIEPFGRRIAEIKVVFIGPEETYPWQEPIKNICQMFNDEKKIESQWKSDSLTALLLTNAARLILACKGK